MKKALILLFLCHFVGQQLFLREWLKLPALFAHFREHRMEKRSFTDLASFFNAHYGCSEHKYAEDHSQLPFQENIACEQIVQLFLDRFEPVTLVRVPLTEKDYVPAYHSRWKSTDAPAVWQPPKVA